MAPKKCCVRNCFTENSGERFFKLDSKNITEVKNVIGKPRSGYICQKHYDLSNDVKGFIKHKYLPVRNAVMTLLPGAVPTKKIPVNVCRICLKLIYREDEFVHVSEQKSSEMFDIMKTCLPEMDLSLTSDPVVCQKCFKPLAAYYQIKKNSLKTEVTVVKCIKEVARRCPTLVVQNCSINLFDKYETLREIKGKLEMKDGIIMTNVEPRKTKETKTETATVKPRTEEKEIQIIKLSDIIPEDQTDEVESSTKKSNSDSKPDNGIFQIVYTDLHTPSNEEVSAFVTV